MGHWVNMKVSINDKIINKNDGKANLSRGFEPADLTPQQLADNIARGYAFSFQFEGAYRKAEYFICSDIIAADFDAGMSLDEARTNEFFISNASILYTTPSHTEENNRFRIIFELPRTITDKEELRYAQRGLTRKFPADRAATDPARQFYGCKGCKPHLFNKVLSASSLAELIELGREPLNQSDKGDTRGNAGARSTLGLESGLMVKTSRGKMSRITDLAVPTPVYCPYHHDDKPSAFITQSKNGVRGIHCSSCQQTFWVKEQEPTPYDFYEFDKLAHQAYNFGIGDTYADGVLEYDIPNPNRVINERYLHLDDIGVADGITLIKSPKGSGKTQYLKKVVELCKKKKRSVLLVGHRRSLIQALSKDLGLTSYLEVNNVGKHFAISVDSLESMLTPGRHQFDVVLVDESEQVFSHLIAETMDHDKRSLCFKIFQYYIKAAKMVIALDADMNAVTLHAIQRFGNKNPLVDRRYILNEYKPTSSQIEVYASENHLVADMLNSIKRGDRIFVACNSKRRVEELVASIHGEMGNDFPVFPITSENSGEDETINFIKNIKKAILDYRVLIVSPAVGTGIDITFPDNLSHVDGVYGVFYPKVNTHNDIDQQISRVRNPKYIKVWISPETYNFEYEVDPIRQELVESRIVAEALIEFEPFSGKPKYDLTNPYLTLYATILSAQRASKNTLKKNFIDLRKHNGWDVIQIIKNEELANEGSLVSKAGKGVALERYIAGILAAPSLTWDQKEELVERKQHSALPDMEEKAIERYWIEYFYGEAITEELLRHDKRGQYRDQIRLLETVMQANPHVGSKDEKAKLLSMLFEAAGLLDPARKLDAEKTVTVEDLKNFIDVCKKRRASIERLLDMEVRQDLKTKPTAQLNRFLALCGLKLANIKTVSRGDKKIYHYQLERESYDKAMGLIARKAKLREKPVLEPDTEPRARATYTVEDPLDKH